MFDDNVGKVVLYVFGIILLFILPLLLIFNNNDITEKSYLNNKVKTFVDEARESGYVSPESYRNFVTDITSIGETYEITMIHKQKTVVPNRTPGKGDYVVSYNYYNKDDILKYMYGTLDDGRDYEKAYSMNEGDFFKVVVVANNPSKGSSFFTSFMHMPGGIKMSASAGGYVGNTHE